MNEAQLITHFDRICEAPNAIPRLRSFILDLAVRGKLLEQNENDEPASVLLERIAAALSVKGIADSSNILLKRGGWPFEVPPGWAWTHLGQICSKTGSGSTPRGGKSVYQARGIPFLRSQNVYDDGLRLDDVAYITQDTHERMSGTAVQAGDLLLNITGGSIGRCCRVACTLGAANVSQHVAIIRAGIDELQAFLHLLIRSPYFQAFIRSEQTGAGRGGLPKNRMDRIPVALPPSAEQRRILATVNDLIALCDRFEAAQVEREKRRDAIISVCSRNLLNCVHSEEYRTHSAFYLQHMGRLVARRPHVDQIRGIIRNLAVRGRLVRQVPRDIPASELIKDILLTRSRLVREGKNPPGSILSPKLQGPPPFEIPDGWAWVRFGEVILGADAGWSPESEDFPRSGENWGVLKVSAVSWDKFRPEENKQLLAGVIPPERAQVREGDFLISRANTSELVAKSVIVHQDPERLILSDKIVRLQIAAGCSKDYINLVNNHSIHARVYYAEEASGTSLSMKNVSRDVIYALLIPLPPMAEQLRIVAKVNELMGVCDRLESQLDSASGGRSRLLDATLYAALHGNIMDTSGRYSNLALCGAPGSPAAQSTSQ